MAWLVRFVAEDEPGQVLATVQAPASSGLARGQTLHLATTAGEVEHSITAIRLRLDPAAGELVQEVTLRRRRPGAAARIDRRYAGLGDDAQLLIASTILACLLVGSVTLVTLYIQDHALFQAWLGYLVRSVVGWGLFLTGLGLVALVMARLRSALLQRLLGTGIATVTLIAVALWLELSRPATPLLDWPADHAAYWRWLSGQAASLWPLMAGGLSWLGLVIGLVGWSAGEKVLGKLAGR